MDLDAIRKRLDLPTPEEFRADLKEIYKQEKWANEVGAYLWGILEKLEYKRELFNE